MLNLKDVEENSKILLNVRQYDLILKIKKDLAKILSLVEQGDSDEIVSFETQHVLNLLNEILGYDVKEDVLHTIFSKFCVGK